MPVAKKVKKFIRVKTPHDAKGLANVKTRPRTATDVKARAVPPYAIREVKRAILTKGVGDIQHIRKKTRKLTRKSAASERRKGVNISESI